MMNFLSSKVLPKETQMSLNVFSTDEAESEMESKTECETDRLELVSK